MKFDIAKKMLGDAQESLDLHNPFYPVDVRSGDPIRSDVMVNGQWVEARIWKLSPLGVEILSTLALEGLNVGDSLDLRIFLGNEVSYQQAVVIKTAYTQENWNLIGIRLVETDLNKSSPMERRKNQRWICSDYYAPTAIASNPIKFNDFVYFKIRDISADGLQLITSLRNKYILKGMVFDCNFSFPMTGSCFSKVRVSNVRISQDGRREILAIGVELLQDYKGKLVELASQYLVQFGNVESPKDLVDTNMKLPSVNTAVEFRYVKTAEEYFEVLKLRKEAYAQEGKVKESDRVETLATQQDSAARIAIGVYKGKIVASACIIFHELNSLAEHEAYTRYDNLPERHLSIEVNRVCTHPDFRGSDLLLGLFRCVAIALAQSGRPWVIMSATKKMFPFYRSLGFQFTGHRFSHGALGDQEHFLLVGNIPEGISGKGVNPVVWNIVYAPVIGYLSQYEKFPLTTERILRIWFYRLFRPIANRILKRKLSRKFRRNYEEQEKTKTEVPDAA